MDLAWNCLVFISVVCLESRKNALNFISLINLSLFSRTDLNGTVLGTGTKVRPLSSIETSDSVSCTDDKFTVSILFVFLSNKLFLNKLTSVRAAPVLVASVVLLRFKSAE